MKKINKLFIDTDLGGDCDDVGAIALANIIKNDGKIDIIGMTYTTSLLWGPCCVDITNKYYGNKSIPIGVTKRKDYCVINTNKYAQKMVEAFNYDIQKANFMEAVELIRKTLANQEDHSVSFVCIGQLDNVSDLLDSKADKYSKLSGIELVKKKVKEFIIMGGLFKNPDEKVMFNGYEYQREYNIVCDIKSAQNFIAKVPVKVVFSDFKVGYQVFTAKPLLDKKDLTNPITFAYYHFQNKPRESWDLLAVYYACFGNDDLFKTSKNGQISILDDGTTLFNDLNSNMNHYHIRLNNSIDYIENKINNILIKGEKND